MRYLQYVRAKSREKALLQHEELLAVLEKQDCAALLALNHRHLHSSLENYLSDFHPTEAESLLAGLQENLAALRLSATGAL